VSVGKCRCPHCGEDAIPRWSVAFGTGLPHRCERCGGRAKLSRWALFWGAFVATLAPVWVAAIVLVGIRSAAAAYALFAVVLFLLFAPLMLLPLRQAGPHDGESILRSIRRHYRRLRGPTS